MIKFLVIQVRIGRITIDQVPEQFRAAVRENLGILQQTFCREGTNHED